MKGDVRVFWCPKCEAHAHLEIDTNHVPDDETPEWEILFGHCVRCDSPGVLENRQIGFESWKLTQLYPAGKRGIDFDLPKRVGDSYREALKCEMAKAPLATAVMVRRTLEAIGKEFDPSAKNLFAGLEAMKKQGVISDELAQWGTELRFIGNIGAHPTDDIVTDRDAGEAVEFLEAIVETIYHLRPKFQAMKQRRAASKVKAPSGDEEES